MNRSFERGHRRGYESHYSSLALLHSSAAHAHCHCSVLAVDECAKCAGLLHACVSAKAQQPLLTFAAFGLARWVLALVAPAQIVVAAAAVARAGDTLKADTGLVFAADTPVGEASSSFLAWTASSDGDGGSHPTQQPSSLPAVSHLREPGCRQWRALLACAEASEGQKNRTTPTAARSWRGRCPARGQGTLVCTAQHIAQAGKVGLRARTPSGGLGDEKSGWRSLDASMNFCFALLHAI